MNPIDCTTCSHASEADPVGSSKSCVGCRRTDGRLAHHNPIGSATADPASVPPTMRPPEEPNLDPFVAETTAHFRKIVRFFEAFDAYFRVPSEERSSELWEEAIRSRSAAEDTYQDLKAALRSVEVVQTDEPKEGK